MFLMYGRIHKKLYLIFESIEKKFDYRRFLIHHPKRQRWLAMPSQAQFYLSSAYQIKKFELEKNCGMKKYEQ